MSITFCVVLGCSAGIVGDHKRTDATAPVNLPAGPVAIIISDSATETAQEIITYNRYYNTGSSANLYSNFLREAYLDASAPKSGVAAITELLEARLGKVHQFKSFEEASRNGFKLIVKLDMQSQLVSTRFSQPSAYVSLKFYSADDQYLGTLESDSRRTATPMWTGHIREKEILSNIPKHSEVQVQALELLRQKLDLVPVKN
ncbi:hypothetical protein [Pseudomonas sp. AM8]|uniref:hypothetical protein n=1 Tax=Pseudomonas sp. AM8 TaxID=2983368 RepID=UPI002E80EC2C|nr:hypothetical protein [Pseudomonas sp. AM8]